MTSADTSLWFLRVLLKSNSRDPLLSSQAQDRMGGEELRFSQHTVYDLTDLYPIRYTGIWIAMGGETIPV